MKKFFPEIITDNVPVRNYGIEGLSVNVEHTPKGTIYFVSAEKDVVFPTHAHAAQWTVVVSGECSFTSNGKTTIYKQGDTYFIPEGQEHQITLHTGYSEFDYVNDPNDGE